MNILDFLLIAYRSLSKNKVRSLLTMLGIIIGVASVITMLAIGQGSKDSIQSQIKNLGTNVIMIFPGAQNRGGVNLDIGASQKLNLDDVKALQTRSSHIKYVSPLARKTCQVITNSKNWRTQVQGIYPNYFDISNYKVAQGEMFTDNQEKSAAKVCLVGQTVTKNLFGDGSSPVGQSIRIDRVPFKIIGTLADKGANMFGQDQDDVIMVPYSTIQKRMLAITYVPQIFVSANSETEIGPAREDITKILREMMKVAPADDSPFNIRTQDEIASFFTSTSNVMISLLASIAAISLLVGGIGIMNIMLVSVTERTREIGLRMSVGARGRDILRQFLLEAVLLSIFGGILGALLGILGAFSLNKLLMWPITLTPYSVALSFAFASMVGIFFGWYPAGKAARLIPIDALRYE